MVEKLAEKIWFNGNIVPWEKATVHVMAHGLHYGSSVFEGIRAYETPSGTCIFQLQAHLRRLLDSARIYRIEVPYTQAQLSDACKTVMHQSGLTSGYIRPIVYRGVGGPGLVPRDVPTEVAIGAWAWGPYLGEGALERGVDTCVSSWTRLAPNTMPTMAKAAGNYLSSQLIAMEAKRNGFDEAIALDINHMVSEGPGENLFLVKDEVLFTPPLTASILPGLVRHTLITLARKMGYTVHETHIGRDMLHVADELFFCGTAVEVTPIRSVDRLLVGDGKRGPITSKLQSAFFGLFNHETPDVWGWLERIDT